MSGAAFGTGLSLWRLGIRSMFRGGLLMRCLDECSMLYIINSKPKQYNIICISNPPLLINRMTAGDSGSNSAKAPIDQGWQTVAILSPRSLPRSLWERCRYPPSLIPRFPWRIHRSFHLTPNIPAEELQAAQEVALRLVDWHFLS